MNSPSRISRRNFAKTIATASASAYAFQFLPSRAWGQIEKPTVAAIGISGKGASDLKGAEAAGFKVAALVDVVDTRKMNGEKVPRISGKLQAEFAGVPYFTDYREMLDKMGDKIDAVTVSTPDHHHFHASYYALQRGKHVYCQKPLTHSIWESRTLAKLAKDTKAKTQMGNQAHARDSMRRCVELIRGGLIGKVKEVHGWTNRPIWPQGMSEPPAAEPVPKWLDWEQWIGPAPFVPFSSKIAPFAWRGIWDYGCGALGDMACHILDMGWWATQPGAPTSVIAEQHGGTKWSPPISSKITWQFGPSKYSWSDGCKFFWYDGYIHAHFDKLKWALVKESEEYNHPGSDVLRDEDFKDFDSLVIGENGTLFFARDRNAWTIRVHNALDGFQWPDPSVPRAPDQDPYKEWFEAATGKRDRAESDFSVAGPFTEMILLGTIAQRLPGTQLEWDDRGLQVKGHPEAATWIRREYRKGWEIPA